MILEGVPATIDRLRRLRFLAVALVGLVVSHDGVFMAQYGVADPGALPGTGHSYWLAFGVLSLLAAGVPLVASAMLVRALHRRLRGEPIPGPLPELPATSYLTELRSLLPRLFITITGCFVVQENVEHVVSGQGLPGLWVLSWPEYPMAIPVLFAVSLVLALAGAWIRWRCVNLVRRLLAVAAWRRWLRAHAIRPGVAWGTLPVRVVTGRLLARRLAGRAPPAVAA